MSKQQINYKTIDEISSHLAPKFDEKQITIHVVMKGKREVSIRPDTFLMCNKPHRKAFLLFSFGAPIYPDTSYGKEHQFTLVFSGLDKECRNFHFIEGKLHPDLLVVPDVPRNKDDVYRINFS